MANYHVNFNTGSDTTGAGTIANPWQTITHALTESSAGVGDTIKVANGSTNVLVGTMTQTTNNGTYTFNTGADYTSDLVIGDIVTISPNITGADEFNGWMKAKITAITSTTITFYQSFSIPNQNTLTFDIYKDSEFVDCGSSGDFQTFNGNLGIGAIVEGGYDNTFTSVIGKTIFRRTGIGANSRSGNWLKVNSSGFSQGEYLHMPQIKNVEWQNFSRGVTTPFSYSAYVQDIAFFNTSVSTGAYGEGAYLSDLSDITTKMTINDGVDTIRQLNNSGYMIQIPVVAALNAAFYYDVKIFNGRNTVKVGIAPIRNLTGYSSNQVYGPFGKSPIIAGAEGTYIDGAISVLLNDDEAISTGYGRTTVISSGYNIQIKPTTLKLVNNGTNARFAPLDLDGTGNEYSYFELPSNYTLEDIKLVGTGASWPGTMYNILEKSTGYLWNVNGGYPQRVNTVDQETGDSCIEFGQAWPSYAAYARMGNFAFPKTKNGVQATSIVIRIKSKVASVNFKAFLYWAKDPMFLTNLGASVGPYTTKTIDLTNIQDNGAQVAFNQSAVIMLALQPDLQTNWQPGEVGLIDSVTVNYGEE